LGIAFKEEVPLEELKTRFDRQFDSTTIGFDALMRALVDALEDAALEIAAQTESPLFNQIVITMLTEVRDSLRQLKQKEPALLGNMSAEPKVFISYARSDAS